MNILPHKSWHVYNKDNVERVRKDEEKHRQEEKEKQDRATLAEQEARINALRAKRGNKTTAKEEVSQHVNLFTDVEKSQRELEARNQKSAEERQEREKWEKKVGLLTHLGQSSKESTKNIPWYEIKQSRGIGVNLTLDHGDKSLDDIQNKRKRQERNKAFEDQFSVDKKSYLFENPVRGKRETHFSKSDETKKSKKSRKHSKKSKKRKERKDSKITRKRSKDLESSKRKRYKDNSSSSSESSSMSRSRSCSPSRSSPLEYEKKQERLSLMRMERIKREQAEKLRTNKKLNIGPATPYVETDERKMRYNNQYNPQYARRNR